MENDLLREIVLPGVDLPEPPPPPVPKAERPVPLGQPVDLLPTAPRSPIAELFYQAIADRARNCSAGRPDAAFFEHAGDVLADVVRHVIEFRLTVAGVPTGAELVGLAQGVCHVWRNVATDSLMLMEEMHRHVLLDNVAADPLRSGPNAADNQRPSDDQGAVPGREAGGSDNIPRGAPGRRPRLNLGL